MKGNIGLCPKNILETKSATRAETNPTMTIDLSNPLLISSKVKMNPARGALNVAASPAPLPHTKRRFSSVFEFVNCLDTPFAAIAPNCTDGPSLPKERPPSAVNVPAVNLAIRVFHQQTSKYPFTSPITWGIPLPELSGSHLTSSAVIIPIIARIKNHASVSRKSPWIYFNVADRKCSEWSSPNLYIDTTNPENKPINTASIINLM